ncbi:MAG: SigE family RNA polymerase sigma factor [Acidimicrobiales bacterium]
MRGPTDTDSGFAEFARSRSAALLRTAYLLVGDLGEAEDLLQVALLRSERHWSRASGAPDAYVRAALVNLATDRWRRRVRRPVETALEDELDAIASADPCAQLLDRAILMAALRELPLRQQAVVVLRFFEDLSVAETAVMLRCSEGAVKSYSSRAFHRLRELLSVETEEVRCHE